MKIAARILATVFGIGFCPVAPGTMASIAAVLAYRIFLHAMPVPWYVLMIALLASAGGLAASAYADELGQKDPSRVVVDEALGQFIALFLVPDRWLPIALAFVFFRLFDIIKPYPIRRLEALPGGWGIMADDVGAGLLAAALVHVACLWI